MAAQPNAQPQPAAIDAVLQHPNAGATRRHQAHLHVVGEARHGEHGEQKRRAAEQRQSQRQRHIDAPFGAR